MTPDDREMLIRIDENVKIWKRANIPARMNRIEGGVIALMAILTLAGGLGIIKASKAKETPRDKPKVYVVSADTSKG